jgi:hypothetical protein
MQPRFTGDEQTSELVVRNGDCELRALRIGAEVAENAEDASALRNKYYQPSPGTEAPPRRYVEFLG